MAYWVYENWVAENKAVIHRASCGHCKDGQGCHILKHLGKNGRWRGRFRTLPDARAAAERTGRPVREHRCVS